METSPAIKPPTRYAGGVFAAGIIMAGLAFVCLFRVLSADDGLLEEVPSVDRWAAATGPLVLLGLAVVVCGLAAIVAELERARDRRT